MTVTDQTDTLSRKETITAWYVKVFPLVAVYIQKKGGNLEEAKEIFQESMVTYYEKLTITGFNPEKTDEARPECWQGGRLCHLVYGCNQEERDD